MALVHVRANLAAGITGGRSRHNAPALSFVPSVSSFQPKQLLAMITVLQFLVVCAAALVEKVFLMDQHSVLREPVRPLLKYQSADDPASAPGVEAPSFE